VDGASVDVGEAVGRWYAYNRRA